MLRVARFACYIEYIEYFMKSAGVRYFMHELLTYIFLIQKQRVQTNSLFLTVQSTLHVYSSF